MLANASDKRPNRLDVPLHICREIEGEIRGVREGAERVCVCVCARGEEDREGGVNLVAKDGDKLRWDVELPIVAHDRVAHCHTPPSNPSAHRDMEQHSAVPHTPRCSTATPLCTATHYHHATKHTAHTPYFTHRHTARCRSPESYTHHSVTEHTATHHHGPLSPRLHLSWP